MIEQITTDPWPFIWAAYFICGIAFLSAGVALGRQRKNLALSLAVLEEAELANRTKKTP